MSFPRFFPSFLPKFPVFEEFKKFFCSASQSPSSTPPGREEHSTDMASGELDRILARDLNSIRCSSEKIIAGYLNLGKADGWEEGYHSMAGSSFTRFILFQYFIRNKDRLGSNTVIFEKVVHSLKECEGQFELFNFETERRAPHPEKSRICFDSTIRGWEKHSVSRLVGNVGSKYFSSKPFFEILVNSARNPSVENLCKPFFISVYVNEKEIEKRRCVLRSLRSAPGNIADVSFYSPSLTKPEDFLKMHQKKLGTNSTRLMTGLIYLQNVTLPAQTVGNCWMKQPMRSLLPLLYVELITNRPELLPAAAWTEAKELYKKIQRDVAIPLVEHMIKESNVTLEMKRTAFLGLEKQKQL